MRGKKFQFFLFVTCKDWVRNLHKSLLVVKEEHVDLVVDETYILADDLRPKVNVILIFGLLHENGVLQI